MTNLIKSLLSLKIAVALLFVLAIVMAIATFVENDHGTAVARYLFYDAWWFEVLYFWLTLVFLFNFQPYRMFSASRWPIGLFHFAFILILVGAGVTRYFSNEGMIHIREGSSQTTYFTTKKYLQIKKEEEFQTRYYSLPLEVIHYGFKPFTQKAEIGGSVLNIHFEAVIPDAEKVFVSGIDTLIDISVLVDDQRQDYTLEKKRKIAARDFTISTFEDDTDSEIQIFRSDTAWMIRTNIPLQMMEMSTQWMSTADSGDVFVAKPLTLYQWKDKAFVIRAFYENSQQTFMRSLDMDDDTSLPTVVKMSVSDADGNEISSFYNTLVSINPRWNTFRMGDHIYSVTYGPKEKDLPFAIKLNAFIMDRYPGSSSPSGYSSDVSVIGAFDEFDYIIYMNNVLDYKGYRFYQASYDTDERGTILSINQDRPGTIITYIGYFFLSVGMFFTLFAKGSRFGYLNRTLRQLKAARKAGIVAGMLVLFQFSGNAQADLLPYFPAELIVPAKEADAFGRLIVQDSDGRMKPLNTLLGEITRKITGRTHFNAETDFGVQKISPEQFLLALLIDAEFLSHQPLIRIHPKKGTEIFEKLQLSPRRALAFQDFIGENAAYLLYEMAEAAHLLKPAERNESHKELLKVDERFNIFYALILGDFLRLFPDRFDFNYTWFTANESNHGFAAEDALFVSNILDHYVEGLSSGIETGDFSKANEALNYIDMFQRKAGEAVYPSETRIEAELIYNRWRLANRLFPFFWLLGTILLALVIVSIVAENRLIRTLIKGGMIFAWLGLGLFTLHLGLRWYIAQYPPWSDGFEMLVFVAWLILLFGLIFVKKSGFTAPLALLFSGTLLFVSFLDWLNPEITSLVPVLHSYWLKIHVSVIVSGYAPLALAAIISLLNLIFLSYPAYRQKEKWLPVIKELTIVSEMAITIGLFLLTIGTFLGGVWANESWGRYWAWDPKETWALISILVYASILHFRLIPALKDSLVFNLAALWGFSTIIMTSFGVNYYLSGLHSYAKGDPVPIPVWVYYMVAVLLVISVFAAIQYRNLNKAEKLKMTA